MRFPKTNTEQATLLMNTTPKNLRKYSAVCMCFLLLAVARSAPAQVQIVAVTNDEPACSDTDGPFIDVPLQVCDVVVHLDEPNMTLLAVGDADIIAIDPGGFFQHPLNFAAFSPLCAFIPGTPSLACDSFITMGLGCSDAADATATAPDFDRVEFNSNGHVVGSWFNSDPSNGQWLPDAGGNVLVARLAVAEGGQIGGTLTAYVQGDFGGSLETCPDVDGDGTVDFFDLALLLASWGTCPGCPADFDGDGSVNVGDLAWLLAGWGPCDPLTLPFIAFELFFECFHLCDTDLDCDDSDPCTEDICEPRGSCSNSELDCSALDDECNVGICDPAAGECVQLPANDGEPCDDGTDCTTDDICDGGACEGTPECECDDDCIDDDECTIDTCDEEGCCQNESECNNDLDCDDQDACTLDFCGEDQCCFFFTECQITMGCLDGNVCTFDVCLPNQCCANPPNSAPCDDRNACTTMDTCAGGVCQPGPPVLCDDGDPCTRDSCNPATGGCLHIPDPRCKAQEPSNEGCGNSKDGGSADSDPVHLFSGEFLESVIDLQIPGRGIEFALRRTYRSKSGALTVQGHNWDTSYGTVFLQVDGDDLLFNDGSGRADRFELQDDGTWGRLEYFRVIELLPDDTYLMTLADQEEWIFEAVPGAPPDVYHRVSMKDRYNNEMTFAYDGQGRLQEVRDALHIPGVNERVVVFAYNSDGFLESVTDWTARQVRYEYYQDGEVGGSFGDLKSVTYPAVEPSPDYPIPPGIGHEYPNGKTWTYTYTTGFEDEQLNHDLLTITDGRRNDPNDPTFGDGPYLEIIYAHSVDPGDPRYTLDSEDPNYDRVVAEVYGGDRYDYLYVTDLDPEQPENNGAVTKITINNRAGDVKQLFYDGRNRLRARREYTGRAPDPASYTDLDQGVNAPIDPLRPDDPPYFETLHEWNADSLISRTIEPNGSRVEYVYEADLDPEAPPRMRGNRREIHHVAGPLGGDQAEIVELFEYDTDFGGCCGFNFVTKHTDGRGHETSYTYDPDDGSMLHIDHRILGIVEDFEYDEYGRMTAHTLPDNGSGHRRRDEYSYYASDAGHQYGYLGQEIIDAQGLALTTAYEYDRAGNMTRQTDARGHDRQYVYNQLNQVVREVSREVSNGGGVRYEHDTFYDANSNIVRVDTQNKDHQGVLQANSHFSTISEYEILNRVVRTCQEKGDFEVPVGQFICDSLPASEFITIEYEYDANRNRVLERKGEAVNGNSPTNLSRSVYDERDLRFRVTRAQGDSDQSTTQYDYDGNHNGKRVVQGLEDVGGELIRLNSYDGYDRLIASSGPMGNVLTYHYDANHNKLSERADGQLIDVPGSAGNVRLSDTTRFYDDMDRPYRTEVEFFDADTQNPIDDGKAVTEIEYNDNSQITRVINDNEHQTLTVYDTANRRSVVTDHLGNTTTLSYDNNSNVIAALKVEKSDLGNPDEQFTTTYDYDGLDRLTKSRDNLGNTAEGVESNTTEYSFDSRNNRVLIIDALVAHSTRYVYDGASRLVKTVRDMNGDGANAAADPGDGDPDIVMVQTWDDSSRLVGQTDDNGNTATYGYDALDRLVSETYEDQTVHSYTYDVHGSKLSSMDANGSATICTYDLLARLSVRNITPGPGVSDDTTIENYTYDGLSRLVAVEDDDSVVTRSYDSLFRVTREILNGQTTQSMYDGVGNKLQSTYPGGRQMGYAYDGLERQKTISDVGAGTTVATYDYAGPARVTRREYGNGTRTDYAYDGITGQPNPADDFGVQRIVGISHSKIAGGAIIDERTFTWDRMFNKLRRVDARATGPQLTHDYAYDALYRLRYSSVTGSGGGTIRDTDYDLDDVGNRQEVIGSPNAGIYTMDPAMPEPADLQMNQYTTTPFDARQYDDNGNLVGRAGLATVRYDYRNQMVEYVDAMAGLRHSFAYDALGRRIAKRTIEAEMTPCGENPAANSCISDEDCALGTACAEVQECIPGGCTCNVDTGFFECAPDCSQQCEPVETRYFYEGQQAVEEQDGSGLTLATYVYGLYIDEVLNMQRGGSDYYYHTDDLYNVMALTGGAGDVVERYEYGDYGQPTITDAEGCNVSCPFDVNGEGQVGAFDLANLLGCWGLVSPGVCEWLDINNSGNIDAFDLANLLGSWGPCPTPSSGIGNPYMFTGRRYDAETGWYYYRTRYLDPAAGRFTTRDPIGIWGDGGNSGNPYAYVGNNPASLVDPYGLKGMKLRNCSEIQMEVAKLNLKTGLGGSVTLTGSWTVCECCDDNGKWIKKGYEKIEASAAFTVGVGLSASFKILGIGFDIGIDGPSINAVRSGAIVTQECGKKAKKAVFKDKLLIKLGTTKNLEAGGMGLEVNVQPQGSVGYGLEITTTYLRPFISVSAEFDLSVWGTVAGIKVRIWKLDPDATSYSDDWGPTVKFR